MKLSLLFGLLCFAQRLAAWDISGHMIVAQVAYTRLNANAAAHLAQLSAQVTYTDNTTVHHYNAVNVAGWADDIKHSFTDPNKGHYKNWHFIDLGVPDSHLDLLTAPPPLTMTDGEIVTALNRCVAVVHGQSDPWIPDEKTAVALIMHLVGDIHQPLHCSAHYYAPGHPGGAVHDLGGNAIGILKFSDTYTNLHSFWDKAYKVKRAWLTKVISSQADLTTFSTTPNDAHVTSWAQAVLNYAPAATVDLKPDFAAWAKETHELGTSEAYGKLTGDIEASPKTLSASYVKNARKVAQKQICLAGYRLAELLNELYP